LHYSNIEWQELYGGSYLLATERAMEFEIYVTKSWVGMEEN